MAPGERMEGHVCAPFVVGVSRSGTTLLRLMLDAHPDVAIPAETRFLPELIAHVAAGADREAAAAFVTGSERWGDFGLDAAEFSERVRALGEFSAGAVARTFYCLYAEGHRKPRWGDKSPPNVTAMPAIHRELAEARFIHVIRDGRDVATSLIARGWGMHRPRRIAQRWVREVSAGRADARALPAGTCLEIRYEALVAEHVELPYDAVMLAYHENASERLAELGDLAARSAAERATQFDRVRRPLDSGRVGIWRRELSAEDRVAFESVAGELLEELGYPTQ